MIEKFPLTIFIPLSNLRFSYLKTKLSVKKFFKKWLNAGTIPRLFVLSFFCLFFVILIKYYLSAVIKIYTQNHFVNIGNAIPFFSQNLLFNSLLSLRDILTTQGLTYIIGIFLILSISQFLLKAKQDFIVITDFSDISIDESTSNQQENGSAEKKKQFRINELLIVELNNIIALYNDIKQEDVLKFSNSNQPLSPVASLQSLKGLDENQLINQDQTLSVGSVSIPIGLIIAFFSKKLNGVQLSGSFGRIDNKLILTANLHDPRRPGKSWSVQESDINKINTSEPENSKPENLKIETMVKILACKIFTGLTEESGSNRWEATYLFNEGLKRYRITLKYGDKRKEDLKNAYEKFSQVLKYDAYYEMIYYNLGMIRKKMAEIETDPVTKEKLFQESVNAYEKERDILPRRWESYIALSSQKYFQTRKRLQDVINCIGSLSEEEKKIVLDNIYKNLENAIALISISQELTEIQDPEVFVTQGMSYLLYSDAMRERAIRTNDEMFNEIMQKGVNCLKRGITTSTHFTPKNSRELELRKYSFIRSINTLGLIYLNWGMCPNDSQKSTHLGNARYLFSKSLMYVPYWEPALYNSAIVNSFLDPVKSKHLSQILISMSPKNFENYLISAINSAICFSADSDPHLKNIEIVKIILQGLKQSNNTISHWRDARIISESITAENNPVLLNIFGKIETLLCLLNINSNAKPIPCVENHNCDLLKQFSNESFLKLIMCICNPDIDSFEDFEESIKKIDLDYHPILDKNWEFGKIYISMGTRFSNQQKKEDAKKSFSKARIYLKDFDPEIKNLDKIEKENKISN